MMLAEAVFIEAAPERDSPFNLAMGVWVSWMSLKDRQTSGGYGHRTGKSLFFACVHPDHAAPGSMFEIYLQGEMRAATLLADPAYDPDNAKMKV